jgi:O-acetylhomoserine/O-acetylserine sulfhydrylase-like pyridoxal-dependent enzyme
MSDLAASYARLHRKFLQDHKPKAFKAFVRDGTLNAYLQRVGQQAADRYEAIVGQMANRADAPLIADEIVLDEIICRPRD